MPSKPIEALLDVNILVVVVFADHLLHKPAREFVETVPLFHTTR